MSKTLWYLWFYIRITNSNKSNRRVRILEVGMQLPESPETPFARRLPQHATVRVCPLSWWPLGSATRILTLRRHCSYSTFLFGVCSDVTMHLPRCDVTFPAHFWNKKYHSSRRDAAAVFLTLFLQYSVWPALLRLKWSNRRGDCSMLRHASVTVLVAEVIDHFWWLFTLMSLWWDLFGDTF